LYKGYYDARNITEFDLNEQLKETIELEELLKDEMLNLPIIMNSIQADIQILEAIDRKESGISTFDFEGQKYKRHEAINIQAQLNKELDEYKLRLAQNDRRLFAYFLNKLTDSEERERLKNLYSKYFQSIKEIEKCSKLIEETMNLIAPIYNGQVDERIARQIIGSVKQKELIIKEALSTAVEKYSEHLTSEELEKTTRYLGAHYDYLHSTGFNDYELRHFHEALGLYSFMLYEGSFKIKKEMLGFQAALVTENASK
jgi:hypothetical protein